MADSTRARSRPLQIGSSVVVLESADSGLLRSIEDLFSGFASAPDPDPASTLLVIIDEANPDDDSPKRYDATLEGSLICQNADQHQLAIALTRRLNRYVLDIEVDRLHLHAGAVTKDGLTVLVIGSSFAGKSTLVAKLVALGWLYLSDEQVGVTSTGELLPFPRPITLRAGSWNFFDEQWFPSSDEGPHDRVEVAPTSLGEVYRGPALAPTIVVCPDVATAEFERHDLRIADTLAKLVGETLDMERASDAGLSAMLTIASNAPGYIIAGQDLAATCGAIAELAASAHALGSDFEEQCVVDSEASARAPGTKSWLFADGSAALFEPVSGALVKVDKAGFEAWQMLGEPADEWPPELASSAFLDQLRSLGLLTSAGDT